MSPRYFDDLEIGDVREQTGWPVSEASIIEFGRRFDPEPFHTDPAAAAGSFFGGLVASGAHTFAMWRRLGWEAALRYEWVLLAGIGCDELRLLRPVRPGDVLHLHSRLIEKIPSRSKPDRGVIRTAERLTNQDGEEVLTLIGLAMAARRLPMPL